MRYPARGAHHRGEDRANGMERFDAFRESGAPRMPQPDHWLSLADGVIDGVNDVCAPFGAHRAAHLQRIACEGSNERAPDSAADRDTPNVVQRCHSGRFLQEDRPLVSWHFLGSIRLFGTTRPRCVRRSRRSR